MTIPKKEYKVGNNTVIVHGTFKKTERLEKALQVYMAEVFKAREEAKCIKQSS